MKLKEAIVHLQEAMIRSGLTSLTVEAPRCILPVVVDNRPTIQKAILIALTKEPQTMSDIHRSVEEIRGCNIPLMSVRSQVYGLKKKGDVELAGRKKKSKSTQNLANVWRLS